MKCNSFSMVILGAVGIFSVISLFCCTQFIFATHELRKLRANADYARNYQMTVQAVVNDCSEYAQRHPDINPILDPVLGKTPQNTAKPSTMK